VADDPQTVDATRRTHLANERTYLAWWRSGLTSIALAIGVGSVIPEIVPGSTWPWAALGTAFGVLGILVVVFGIQRQAAVDRALQRGGYVPFGRVPALLLGVFAAALGIATVVLILATV
jgi:putative membrane protein